MSPTPMMVSAQYQGTKRNMRVPMANTAVHEYKINTACRWVCPISSSRWWRWARSASKGDIPRRSLRNTAREKSRRGTIRTAKGKITGKKAGSNWVGLRAPGSICPVTEIALTDIINPTRSAPESPKNSFAGFQFSGKKPKSEPASRTVMIVAKPK